MNDFGIFWDNSFTRYAPLPSLTLVPPILTLPTKQTARICTQDHASFHFGGCLFPGQKCDCVSLWLMISFIDLARFDVSNEIPLKVKLLLSKTYSQAQPSCGEITKSSGLTIGSGILSVFFSVTDSFVESHLHYTVLKNILQAGKSFPWCLKQVMICHDLISESPKQSDLSPPRQKSKACTRLDCTRRLFDTKRRYSASDSEFSLRDPDNGWLGISQFVSQLRAKRNSSWSITMPFLLSLITRALTSRPQHQAASWIIYLIVSGKWQLVAAPHASHMCLKWSPD